MLMGDMLPGDIFKFIFKNHEFIGIKIKINPNIPQNGRGQAASIVILYPEESKGSCMTEDTFYLYRDFEVTKIIMGIKEC